jgi:hypothetical protein
MNQISPSQLAERVLKLAISDSHVLIPDPSVVLRTEHACELLKIASQPCTWYQRVAILIIGCDKFDNEFVDYAIDSLFFPPWGADPMTLLVTGDDPFAVGMHAVNLLLTRKHITAAQFHRIQHLPTFVPVKQRLISALKLRVRS